MQKFVEHLDRSVLCVGYISEERYQCMTTDTMFLELYKNRMQSIYHNLAADGYNTFIFTAWNIFEMIAAGMLQIAKPEICQQYGRDMVYSMAIFETSREFRESPPYHNYFDEVLLPQQDNDYITTAELFSDILSNVSVVLFDNKDGDPFIESILHTARKENKKMLDISSFDR